jgi:hypothetical protein
VQGGAPEHSHGRTARARRKRRQLWLRPLPQIPYMTCPYGTMPTDSTSSTLCAPLSSLSPFLTNIHQLDTLLYQLHVLSFLLAPALPALLVRAAAQFQLARPRTLQPTRGLRFWYALVLLANAVPLWTHADAPGVGRAVVLDFIGVGA